jgi:hypothetical protein
LGRSPGPTLADMASPLRHPEEYRIMHNIATNDFPVYDLDHPGAI